MGNIAVSENQNVDLPKNSADRRLTDLPWIVIYLAVVFMLFLPFLITTAAIGELQPKIFFYGDRIDLAKFKHLWLLVLLVTIVIAAILSYLSLVFLRFCAAVAVWGILILLIPAFLALCIYLGILAGDSSNVLEDRIYCGTGSIICGLLVIIIIVLILVYRKRIGLCVILLREASKRIFNMPQLILISFIGSVVHALFLILFIATAAWLLRFGSFVPSGHEIVFAREWYVHVTYFFGVITGLWTCRIIVSCQYMCISGAISRWYFAREKGNFIPTSLKNTLKYHLGTIIKGSFIVASFVLVRAVISFFLERCRWVGWCIDSLLAQIEALVVFLTDITFVETALNGDPFCKSGRRAAKILLGNLKNTLVVKTVGDIIFCLYVCGIVIISCEAGLAIGFTQSVRETNYVVFSKMYQVLIHGSLLLIVSNMESYVGIVLIVITSCFVASCIFRTLQAVIDTLFICYCEDIAINDGSSRPYRMPDGLKKFFEQSETVLKAKQDNSNPS